MLHFKFIPTLSISIAIVILFSLSLQYPLSTTFPIGGDAPSYVKRAQAVLSFVNNPTESIEALRIAWYPLSLLIFSTSAVLPIDWPSRFIWYTTASHIITGLILARLLYKISGWRTAALVMVIWAITTTGITGHVEDGTLAQLISFIFLALFLERLASKATWTALLALVATTLTHPVTGLFLLVTIMLSSPILISSWPKLDSTEKKQTAIIWPTSILLLILIVFVGKSVFANAVNVVGAANNPFIDILVSRFSPFVVLSFLGLLIFLKTNKSIITKFLVAMLFSLSAIMAGNDLLGISVWSDRLSPLFIFTVTILSAIGLNSTIQAVFSKTLTRSLFVAIFISIISISAWRTNMNVFAFYENNDNNARLHPNELSAIHWMRDNLPPDSLIITTNKNRHAEWIPVLTSHEWLPVSENDGYFFDPDNISDEPPNYDKQKYVVFFTLTEDIRDKFIQSPNKYPHIFSNDAIAIYNIPPR